jgi:thiamine biosynthesis protein ThiI
MQYIVRFGSDIVIKSSRIRAQFVRRMVANIQAGFKVRGIKAEIKREWGRLLVRSDDPAVKDLLCRVFGVCFVAEIEHSCSANLDEITAFTSTLEQRVAGKTFAVRVKRVGEHPFSSVDLAKKVAATVFHHAKGVDLSHPEVEIFVEVREGEAIIFSKRHLGPSGLPLGVGGRALCLLSGGFDSAVAAWLMQKRGIAVDYLFCNLAGAAYEKSVLSLAKFLTDEWSYGTSPQLFVVDMNAVVQEILHKVKPPYAQIVLKRVLYRLAETFAEETGAEAIITGECIGQVSSQTLPNLRSIEAAVEIPVLRPLLCFDKEQIIAFSRRIGTYPISAGVEEYCQLVPDKPVTACTTAMAAFHEGTMDLSVLTIAKNSVQKINLGALSQADLVTPYLFADEIDSADVVIDCRPSDAFALWHYQKAINIEFYELLTNYTKLKKNQRYILYCPIGLQSAVLAEKLQKLGYEAFSFRGGVSGLKSYSEKI